MTPSRSKRDKLMVLLLAGGPTDRNSHGELPIHYSESAAVTKILVDLGGLHTIDAVDANGDTHPLCCA